MKTLLLILIIASGATAQTYWEPAAFNSRQAIEIYGAEHHSDDLITVWFRTNTLRRGVWRREVKVMIMVDCQTMIAAPMRVNPANTRSARIIPTYLAESYVNRMPRGSLGYRAATVACERVFGYQ